MHAPYLSGKVRKRTEIVDRRARKRYGHRKPLGRRSAITHLDRRWLRYSFCICQFWNSVQS